MFQLLLRKMLVLPDKLCPLREILIEQSGLQHGAFGAKYRDERLPQQDHFVVMFVNLVQGKASGRQLPAELFL